MAVDGHQAAPAVQLPDIFHYGAAVIDAKGLHSEVLISYQSTSTACATALQDLAMSSGSICPVEQAKSLRRPHGKSRRDRRDQMAS